MTLFNKETIFVKNNTFYILSVFVLLNFLFSSCNNEKNDVIRNGIADISNVNFSKGDIVQLNGDWEFYYGKLLNPSDFSDTSNLPVKQYINVPQSWTKEYSEHKYKRFGSATYRLKIKINNTQNKQSQVIFVGKRIFSAYKVWLNGKLISRAGETSEKGDAYKADLKLLISNPVYLQKENELIIQVSNFTDKHAGILRSISIEEAHFVTKSLLSELILIISILSIIFIISVYHLILFLFRKNDYSNLVFSFLGFVFIITGLMGNDTILKNILSPSYLSITRFFHLSISLYPVLITLFFYLLYKNKADKKFLIFTVIISFVLSILSLFLNVAIVRVYIEAKIIYLLAVSLWFIVYSLPKSVANKKQGARWAFLGMLAIFLTNINDILFTLGYIQTGYLAIYGFFIFIIFQSMIISERFSSIFNKNLKLTEELKVQNENLYEAKIKAENADRLKSAFLANMSHEIRTPMNAILGFSNLLNAENINNEKRKRLVSYITNSGNTLLQLINDIIDISKIEAEQLEINLSEFKLTDLFDELKLIYSEKENSDISDMVELKFIRKENKKLTIHTDSIRLKQILINLIDNALKFTEKGVVEVSCELTGDNDILFCVKDSGIGLTEEQKETIFTRFIKLENEGEKIYRGAGLGLSISKNIVRLLGGKIWVDSEINKGTAFYFTISAK
ncbi:MAG: hypothetical protein GXO80_11005 [Chlorobi bacterium]|nr:hypothetical protein [Chlorobiota bacterium]